MKFKRTIADIEIAYISHDDIDDIVKMLKKERVCEHVFFGPNTEVETKAYFLPMINVITESLQKNKVPTDHIFVLKKDNVLIGNCGIVQIPFTVGNYSIGFTIDDKYWKQGYGDMACKFLIDFGFKNLKAYKLNGDCMESNIGSRKIMENNGFKMEGRQVKHWFKNGKYVDNLLLGLFS